MARDTSRVGYSKFGGGADDSWLHVEAPYTPALRDGTGIADKPSGIVVDAVSDAGAVTSYWIWVDSNGLLHSATSEPTNQDASTSIMAPKNIQVSTIGLDPQASINDGSVIEVATTITGVAAGDLVFIERAAHGGATVHFTGYSIDPVGRVTATGTVAFRFRNLAGTLITPEPETVRYVWFDLT